MATRIGLAAADLDVRDASYMIGALYTGMMPGTSRADLGAFYTPPVLCERLLDMATEAGLTGARFAYSIRPAAAVHFCRP